MSLWAVAVPRGCQQWKLSQIVNLNELKAQTCSGLYISNAICRPGPSLEAIHKHFVSANIVPSFRTLKFLLKQVNDVSKYNVWFPLYLCSLSVLVHD